MARPKEIKTCLVCTNVDCASRGSKALLDAFKEKLEAAGSDIEVKSYLCFGACQDGPNIVLYPEGTWYMGVQMSDVDEIVAHMLGGEPVTRLTERVDPGLRDLILEILESGMIDL
ncbi:MAG TPA: (2Fe-2S) ferredoxin domain-containing protein [Chloroflexota bacterium]|nr:(2Fe-2S) ferredoxin domain-containing protein [Chloroflexota bacterium]